MASAPTAARAPVPDPILDRSLTVSDEELAILTLQLDEITQFQHSQEAGPDEDDEAVAAVSAAYAAWHESLTACMQTLTDARMARMIAGVSVSGSGAAGTEAATRRGGVGAGAEVNIPHAESSAAAERRAARMSAQGEEVKEKDEEDARAEKWGWMDNKYDQPDEAFDNGQGKGKKRADLSCVSPMATRSIYELLDNKGDAESDTDGKETTFAAGSASSAAIVPTTKDKPRTLSCVVCTEDIIKSATLTLACGDVYCVDCLRGHLLSCCNDQTMFPPRCCKQQIPEDTIMGVLTDEGERARFALARIERETADKTYCSGVDCGRFVPPEKMERVSNRADCTACGAQTCTLCKGQFHPRGECAQDMALQQLLDTAGTEGWRRCPGCRAVVELSTGCNHMTCKCATEFCYLCGMRWKKCSCEQFTARYLEARVDEVYDREVGDGLAMQPLQRVQRQRQIRQDIVAYHECDHPGRFQMINSHSPRHGYLCEMCGARHWKFILRCRHCHIDVCMDCRRWRV